MVIRNKALLSGIVLVLLCSLTPPRSFAEDPYEFDDDYSSRTSFSVDSSPVTIQMGLFSRVGGTRIRDGKKSFILAGNMDYIGHRRSGWAQGLGLRIVADDDGFRVGFRGLVRWRAGNPRFYVQAAPWISVAGKDNHRELNQPGCGLELEVGHDSWAALVAGFEVIPYRDYHLGRQGEGFFTTEIIDRKGTEVSYYMGGKLNGLGKVLLGCLALYLYEGLSY